MMKFKQYPKYCRPCLERLAKQAMNLACPKNPENEKKALDWLEELYSPDLPPPIIASRLHQKIKTYCKNPDPYLPIKEKEIDVARRLSKELLQNYGEDISSLIAFALLGNAIDFFRPPEEIEEAFRQGVKLAVDHRPQVLKSLEKAQCILYLTDNAGEVFFDLPLLKALSQAGLDVYYAVKPEPMQNDLCREDLARIKLELPVKVIDTGAKIVGLVLNEASPEFKEIYQKANIIFAKGMGHFETISNEPGLEKVVFMLCAKCIPVANTLKVPLNSYLIVSPADLS